MNGLILLNKPKGYTSFKAAAVIKRVYGEKRVGHTGTLDPLATGVLPILIGRATRLCSYGLESDKRYTATVKLGLTTDSFDITGKIIYRTDANITDDQLMAAINRFKGEYDQLQPMFSAIKKDGVRLYSLARRGIEVERETRRVNIKEINLLCRNSDEFKIDVLCSKGTYIRSLAHDIGQYLGCGAVMTELVRTKTAQFLRSECATVEQLEKDPEGCLLSPERAVEHLKVVNYSTAQGSRFMHGAEIDVNRIEFYDNVKNGEIFRVRCEEKFLGLAEYFKEGQVLKTRCVISD